jgi:hypothetical protein
MASANLNNAEFNNLGQAFNNIQSKEKDYIFPFIKRFFEAYYFTDSKENNVTKYWKSYFLSPTQSNDYPNIRIFLNETFSNTKYKSFYDTLVSKKSIDELYDVDFNQFTKILNDYFQKLQKNELNRLSKKYNTSKASKSSNKYDFSVSLFNYLNNNSKDLLNQLKNKDSDFENYYRIISLRTDSDPAIKSLIKALESNNFDFSLLYQQLIKNNTKYGIPINHKINSLEQSIKKTTIDKIDDLFKQFMMLLFESRGYNKQIIYDYYESVSSLSRKHKGGNKTKTLKRKTLKRKTFKNKKKNI